MPSNELSFPFEHSLTLCKFVLIQTSSFNEIGIMILMSINLDILAKIVFEIEITFHFGPEI